MDRKGADALAAALGLRYSGNMHTCSLTMVADPAVKLGTTIRVPKFPDLMPVDNRLNQNAHTLAVQKTPWYYYYVYGITYNLQVGGQWTMTLDLRYGRDEKLQFPYLNYSPYQTDLTAGSLSSLTQSIQNGGGNQITLLQYGNDPNFPSRIATPFSPQAAKTDINYAPLTSQTVAMDPNRIPVGSRVMLTDAQGKSLGEFTTVAGPPGLGLGLLKPPKGHPQVYLTIENVGPYALDAGVPGGTNQPSSATCETSAGAGGTGSPWPGTNCGRSWPSGPPPGRPRTPPPSSTNCKRSSPAMKSRAWCKPVAGPKSWPGAARPCSRSPGRPVPRPGPPPGSRLAWTMSFSG
jgi:hypothetical protein